MCTVTYLPPSADRGFILTSNRDEKSFRPTIPPEIYLHNGVKMGFPRDEKAGGTWIAATSIGRLCCLLNGAFVAHKKEDFHTKSRGIVLFELASSQVEPNLFFAGYDLSRVEPFTIITIDFVHDETIDISEFVWDGIQKHFRILDSRKPYIWSSVTLYNNEQRASRREWFTYFLDEKGDNLLPADALAFHASNHTNDRSLNVIMEREGGLKTVSITQVVPSVMGFEMSYSDLLNKSKHTIVI
jgi:hypothetical protein